MRPIETTKREVKDVIEPLIGEKTIVYIGRQRIKMPDYVMVYQKAADMLFDKKMSGKAYKILFYFISLDAYGNVIPVTIDMIMKKCDMSKASAQRATQELEKLKIIYKAKDCNDARIKTYCINPVLAWKGEERKRAEMIRGLTLSAREEQRMLGANSNAFDTYPPTMTIQTPALPNKRKKGKKTVIHPSQLAMDFSIPYFNK